VPVIPYTTQRAAASALSSGLVLKAMLAPGAASNISPREGHFPNRLSYALEQFPNVDTVAPLDAL
jgi:hypothetical protein